MSRQYYWQTPVTANTVTLISYTFGRLTGGKNTDKTPNLTKSGYLGAPVQTPLTPIRLKFGITRSHGSARVL